MHCVSCLPGGYDGQSGNGKVSADVEDVPGLSHQTLLGVHHQQGHVLLPGGGGANRSWRGGTGSVSNPDLY